ncbi:MAG TPA: hypothetical protein VNU71_06830 [Burkholderiaceae bacterium]|nr:hypothetical protein [Burkholderiaceae bacterium]
MASLVLDANVLVLFVVGTVDRRSIRSHRRCREFTEADFDLLVATVGRFERVVVTTSVLTETSNLLAYANGALRERLLDALRGFVALAFEERHESATVMTERVFVRLGLTDAGLMTCVRSGHYLLTADLDLYLAARAVSENVENFNHLRQNSLLS